MISRLRGLTAWRTAARNAYRRPCSLKHASLRYLGALSAPGRIPGRLPLDLRDAITSLPLSAGRSLRGLTTSTSQATDKPDTDPFLTPKNERFPYHEVYSVLNVQDKQIRLVSLASGTGDDPIDCELFTTSLVSHPAYEALSHCAGDPKDCSQIRLNGNPFNVFRSVYSALRQLRQPSRPREIWIDQICINQIDVRERNAQTSITKDIYKRATSTVVWLGPAGTHNSAAFDLLDEFCATQKQGIHEVVRAYMTEVQEFGDRQGPEVGEFIQRYDEDSIPGWLMQMIDILVSKDTLHPNMAQAMDWILTKSNDPSRTDTWNAINDIVSRPWWSHCWSVTEFLTSTNITFHCGERSIDWQNLDLFTAAAIVTRVRKGPLEDNTILDDFIVSARNQFDLFHTRRHQLKAGGTLLHYLNSTSNCSASDPRDKVYAMLGLIPDERTKDYGIEVDYSRDVTVADVFTAATKAIIFHDHVWPFTLIGPDSVRAGFPSWVPSFEYGEPVFLRDRYWFAAGGPGHPQPEFFENDTVMRVSGIKLASFKDGLYAQWPLEDDTVEREDAVADWVSAVVAHLRRRDTMTPRAVLDFLEVFGYNDFYGRLPAVSDDPGKDMLALGAPINSIFLDEFDAATVALRDCRFFMLRDGTMGLVPSQTQIGDMIFVPRSGDGAIVVRETVTKGRFVVIGECYVHGIMAGELVIEECYEHGIMARAPFPGPSEPEMTTIDLV